MTCYGPGGSFSETATVTINPATVGLTPNPGSVDLYKTSVINWGITNVTTLNSCALGDAWGSSSPPPLHPSSCSGNYTTPSLVAPTTYSIGSCTGPGGKQNPDPESVTVGINDPNINMAAVPAQLHLSELSGGSVIKWGRDAVGTNSPSDDIGNVTSTANCTLSAIPPASGWSGTLSAFHGTYATGPLSSSNLTYTYNITCKGAGQNGGTTTGKAIVSVAPPEVSINASSTTISPGSSTVITWNSTDTTACVESWVNSTTGNPNWANSLSNSVGTNTGPLTDNTTYSISCTGAAGATAQDSVTVSMNTGAPTITEFKATPPAVSPGDSTTITWSSTNATNCNVSSTTDGVNWTAVGSGTSNTTGVSSGPLTKDTTYEITCHGPGGDTQRSITVRVGNFICPDMGAINVSSTNSWADNDHPNNLLPGDYVTSSWQFTPPSSVDPCDQGCANLSHNGYTNLPASAAAPADCPYTLIPVQGSAGPLYALKKVDTKLAAIGEGDLGLSWLKNSLLNIAKAFVVWPGTSTSSYTQGLSPSAYYDDWLVFSDPAKTNSSHINFSVGTGSSTALTINGTTIGSFTVGQKWTLDITSNMPKTNFSFCVNSNSSCNPYTTDANGNWTLSGDFPLSTVGSWSEWAVFPGGVNSDTISFTVGAAPFAALMVNTTTINAFGFGQTITYALASNIPKTSFEVCYKLDGVAQPCVNSSFTDPNYQTDPSGNWSTQQTQDLSTTGAAGHSYEDWFVFRDSDQTNSSHVNFIVSPGTLAINGVTAGSFTVGQAWTLNVTSSMPNTSFTIECSMDSGAPFACDSGTTDPNGNWTTLGGDTFPASVAGSWEEWVVFSNGASSTHINFKVSQGPTAALTINGVTTGSFTVGQKWTLNIASNMPSTNFSFCVNSGSNCRPYTTDPNGNWSLSGTFNSDSIGSWSEWAVFPGGPNSNSISFTVGAAPFAALTINGATSGNFGANQAWILNIASNMPSTNFSFCVNSGSNCRPYTTDPNGNWSLSGTFNSDSIGSWSEWAIFSNSAQTYSNLINFSVASISPATLTINGAAAGTSGVGQTVTYTLVSGVPSASFKVCYDYNGVTQPCLTDPKYFTDAYGNWSTKQTLTPNTAGSAALFNIEWDPLAEITVTSTSPIPPPSCPDGQICFNETSTAEGTVAVSNNGADHSQLDWSVSDQSSANFPSWLTVSPLSSTSTGSTGPINKDGQPQTVNVDCDTSSVPFGTQTSTVLVFSGMTHGIPGQQAADSPRTVTVNLSLAIPPVTINPANATTTVYTPVAFTVAGGMGTSYSCSVSGPAYVSCAVLGENIPFNISFPAVGTYTITVTDTDPTNTTGDNTATASVVVAVVPASCDFSASAGGLSTNCILLSASTTLSWSCEYVDPVKGCTLNGSAVASSGSRIVFPTSTTVYTLHCAGAGGGQDAIVPLQVCVRTQSWKEIPP